MSLRKFALPFGWKRLFRIVYFGGLLALTFLSIQSGDKIEITVQVLLVVAFVAPFLFWLSLAAICYVLEGFKGKGKVKTEDLFGKWLSRNPIHGLIALAPVFLILIGIVFNSDLAAVILGRFFASLIDPVTIGVGILLGFLFIHNYWKFLSATVIGGVAYAVLIAIIVVAIDQGSHPNLNLMDVPYYHYLANFSVVFWIAHITNLVRIAREKKVSV